MKNIIRERRRLRSEFIKANEEEVRLLLKEHDEKISRMDYSVGLNERGNKLAEKIRKEIAYSPKTNDLDIIHGLLMLAKKIL